MSGVNHVYASKFANVGPHHDAPKDLVSASSNTREHVVSATSHSLNSTTPGNTSFLTQLSPSLVLDRTIYVRSQVKCTVTAATVNEPFISTKGACLAQFPLSRVMSSVSGKFNTTPINFEPWRFSRAMWKLHDSSDLRRMNSLSPSQPDQFSHIAMNAIAGGAAVNSTGWLANTTLAVPGDGAANSPYASIVGEGHCHSRSSFPPSEITYTAKSGSVADSLEMVFTITEPIMLPLLSTGAEAADALARIQTLAVDIRWNNLNGLLTLAEQLCLNETSSNPEASTVVVNGFVGTCDLLYRTYSPYVKIPPVVKKNFFDIVSRSFDVSFTNVGDSKKVSTNAIRFNQVPHKIMVFCSPKNEITSTSVSDGFAGITGLTLRTDQDTGNFSGASAEQLHEMSARNGVAQSFQEWRYNQGSVLLIDLTKGDVSGFVPGVNRDFSFDMDVSVQNINWTQCIAGKVNTSQTTALASLVPAGETQYQLHVVAFMDATFISNGTTSSIEYGVNPDVALAALSADPDMEESQLSSHHLQGAGFFGSLGRGISRGIRRIGNRVVNRGIDTAIDAGMARLAGGGVQGSGVRAGGLRVM